MQRPSQAEKERRQRWRERENNDAGSELIKPQTGMCSAHCALSRWNVLLFSQKQCTYISFFSNMHFFQLQRNQSEHTIRQAG